MKIHNIIQTLRKNGVRTGVMHYRYVKKTPDSKPELVHVTQENRKEVGLILSNGGYTSVRLSFPDGSEHIEESTCGPRDTFARRLGIGIAVGRILKKRRDAGIIDNFK